MFWLCWHWKLFSCLFFLLLFSCLLGGCHTIHELFWSSPGKKTFTAKIESTLFCCSKLILKFYCTLKVCLKVDFMKLVCGGKLYSGDKKTGHVRILDGRRLSRWTSVISVDEAQVLLFCQKINMDFRDICGLSASAFVLSTNKWFSFPFFIWNILSYISHVQTA